MDVKRVNRRPGSRPTPRSTERPRIVTPPPPAAAQVPAARASQPTPSAAPAKSVTPLSKIITAAYASKKSTLITVAAVVVAGGLLTGVIIGKNTSSEAHLTNSPQFATILPGGKVIDQLGGWQRVSPPKNDPVFAYADTIENVPIIVSQQPLPDSFRTNVDSHVAELAKNYNATTKLDAGETAVYVGLSAAGPQSTIFTKQNLLIMIKSEKEISDAAWIEYAKSLTRNSY